MDISGFLIFALVLVVIAVLFAFQSVKVVPQQTAWVVERLGKFNGSSRKSGERSLDF